MKSEDLVLQSSEPSFMKTAEIADGQETHHQQVVNIVSHYLIISPISMLWLPNSLSHWFPHLTLLNRIALSPLVYQASTSKFHCLGYTVYTGSLSQLYSLHRLIVLTTRPSWTHCIGYTVYRLTVLATRPHCLDFTVYTNSLYLLSCLHCLNVLAT